MTSFWAHFLARPLCSNESMIVLKILPEIFLDDFAGHFFPTKMRTNPATKSVKKSGGSKEKYK